MKPLYCRHIALPLLSALLIAEIALAAPVGHEIDTRELSSPPAASRKAPATARSRIEINLNELRAELAGKKKPRRQQHKKRAAPAKAVATAEGGSSRYTIKSGEHISLILVRHYGLKETEAYKLLPEVLKLNNLSDARKVPVGRTLVIPLPAPGTTVTTKPSAAPAPGTTVQPATATTVKPVDACAFARQALNRLGLTAAGAPTDTPNFSSAYRGITANLVCAPSAAELITYQRLSAVRDEQLIVLQPTDKPEATIEQLGHQLGLTYRASGDGYIFTLTGTDNQQQEIRISNQ